MNALQITPDYIRDEKDFLTPLSLSQRLRQLFAPQAITAQAYPTNWIPAIDISGIGQTKDIAKAFPMLYAAGWKLLIMRASIGLSQDVLFDYFWRAGADAGMYMMAYHFGYPGYSGISQASLFLRTIEPMLTEVDGHSAAVLDVEAPGDVAAWRSTVTNFHSTTKLELVTGDYSSVAKWQSCTGNMVVPGFAWNASWSSLSDVPSFAPKERTFLRQVGVHLKHAWVPKPPGVNEDVDVNYFMGDEASLRKFLGYDDTPPPPPPPPPPDPDVNTRLIALEVGFNNLASEVRANKTEATMALTTLATENHAEHLKMQEDISNLQSSGGTPSTKPRFQIGGSQANCRVIHGYNDPDPPATPKPIMVIPPVGPHRIQFPAGTIVLLASNVKVDADGSVDYYMVDPSQYPAGEPAQYLRTIDGVLL